MFHCTLYLTHKHTHKHTHCCQVITLQGASLVSEIALQLVMRALSSSNIGTNTSLPPTHTGEHLLRHHFSSDSAVKCASSDSAIEVKGDGLPFSAQKVVLLILFA